MATKGGYRDTITGAIVVLVAAVLLVLVYAKEDHPKRQESAAGYLLKARFNKADGISVGSDVRLSGVSVGKVVEQRLAPDFRAIISMRIAPNVLLTTDTAAAIHTDGLLGAKYIELKPGGDEATLKPGQEIPYTQDAMVLEDLVEMIINQAKAKRGYAGRPIPSITN
ncbi:MAG TPA: MlaD family protein [Magnetospirillum sp.]|jgi:phospholipid/cholesterol/gamma-HCH transport system substrate-binding protein|nr:MlaD family protein [Magnetospirillum sp.]